MQVNLLNRITGIALAAVCLAAPALAADPTPAAIVKDMKRVADWQLAHPSKHKPHDWTHAPFYMGLGHLFQVSGDATYRDALDGFGKPLGYGPGPRVTHADDHAILQAWLMLYQLDRDPAKLNPSVAHFDTVRQALANEPKRSISGGTFTWDWCDALFMSPAVWAELSQITGDPKFLEWSDREWWTTTDMLYDPEAHLYYRDARFFGQKTASGRKTFWARGNGWVCGGLVHVLDRLPANHPSRVKYLGLYHDMMAALLKLQNPDGLWRSSLLDPEGPIGESSGTSFFTYAMAWGLNRGLLPAKTYRPAVMKGLTALMKNIQPDGMLGFVQRVDDRPDGSTITAQATEIYGSGAFLLAGSEVVRLLDPSKARKGLATFKGVTLPDRFVPAAPRTCARFVPERKDDFAWENDLVAFRAYGPALRSGPENSGFDCWFKRVPYPVMDKWYIEDVTVLKHSKATKTYHQDQGEGYDGYKVGDTRGCGGISVFADGQLYNSETFVGHRIIENTPQRVAFELDYASDFKGAVLRETKRITLIMGERLFQCDSRFTLDGKPAASLPVAIGLMPQVPGTTPVFAPKTGQMRLWENLEGLGLGTAVVIDPKRVDKMITHTDAANQTQALCLAKTDATGHIRWFAGFGWQGQGEITTDAKWQAYLTKFAARYLKTPYAKPEFKVHTSNIP